METRNKLFTTQSFYVDSASDKDGDAATGSDVEMADPTEGTLDRDDASASDYSDQSEDEDEDESASNNHAGDISEEDSDEFNPEDDNDDDDSVTVTPENFKKLSVGASTGPAADPHDIEPCPQDGRGVRSYHGPLDRIDRHRMLMRTLYGPDQSHLALMHTMRAHWQHHSVLPARVLYGHGGMMPSPWAHEGSDAAWQWRYEQWHRDEIGSVKDQIQEGSTTPAGVESMGEENAVALFHGPAAMQTRVMVLVGEAIQCGQTSSSAATAGFEGETESPAWIFNVGGIPTHMSWAPLMEDGLWQHNHAVQLLSIAVLPHEDRKAQKDILNTKKLGNPGGCVQIWEVYFARDGRGSTVRSAGKPRIVGHFVHGESKIKRVLWCPVLLKSDSSLGLLAYLADDGYVHVVNVKRSDKKDGSLYGGVSTPISSLGFKHEDGTEATCFTWVSHNRMAVGHTDGSISLWQLSPRSLLLRFSAHRNYVMDICSGYPSKPFIVASTPVGGRLWQHDLQSPNHENARTRVEIVSFQPNMLAWSDHLQGWTSITPATNPSIASVAFLHNRRFAGPRSLFSGLAAATSLAVGAHHPYLLVGCADGSLWCSNAVRKLLPARDEPVFKMKLFHSEFRPVGEAAAEVVGAAMAVRVFTGFPAERNNHPLSEMHREVQIKARLAKAKAGATAKGKGKAVAKGRGKGRAVAKPSDAESATADGPEAANGDGDDDYTQDSAASEGGGGRRVGGRKDGGMTVWRNPERDVIHEALTRISAVAWNPNLAFGFWAAAGMATGLVRVMDLGVGPGQTRPAEDAPQDEGDDEGDAEDAGFDTSTSA